MQKPKWLSEGALQIDVKRREVKSKGEKERQDFPLECNVPKNSKKRKKGFLSDQCKEIKENKRMRKTRDLFQKLEIPREHCMQRQA